MGHSLPLKIESLLTQERFVSHSIRVGAVTTAAGNGVQDSLIETLGREGGRACSALGHLRMSRPCHFSF